MFTTAGHMCKSYNRSENSIQRRILDLFSRSMISLVISIQAPKVRTFHSRSEHIFQLKKLNLAYVEFFKLYVESFDRELNNVITFDI